MRTPLALFVLFVGAGVLASGCMSASSDPLPRRVVHVRGTVESVTGSVLTVATATGLVPVELLPPSQVSLVVASDRAHLTDGSYMGITYLKQPDGSLLVTEVHIFPLGTRRSGEGSYASDLSGLNAGGTTMTNGTASRGSARVVNAELGVPGLSGGDMQAFRTMQGKLAGGTSIALQLKCVGMSHLESLTIPWGVPIVRFAEGRTWDLKPGAHVVVIATRRLDGELSADRVLVGKNGLVPAL